MIGGLPITSGEKAETPLIRRFSRAISRLFRDDPFPVAVWSAGVRVYRAMVDALQSRIYMAPGLHLGPGALVRGARHITFGKGIYIHGGVWLEALSEYAGQPFSPKIEIGDKVCMSHGVHISCIDRVTLRSGILIGSHVHISDHGHGSYSGIEPSHPTVPPSWRALRGGPVLIEENVWIGDNAVIMGPVQIGSGAVIGANSVVKKDIPPNTIAAGIPCRVLKKFDSEQGTWNRV